jgi:hypothetical protein
MKYSDRIAHDVIIRTSSIGDSAGRGYDAATGYGLVDAYKAWQSIP